MESNRATVHNIAHIARTGHQEGFTHNYTRTQTLARARLLTCYLIPGSVRRPADEGVVIKPKTAAHTHTRHSNHCINMPYLRMGKLLTHLNAFCGPLFGRVNIYT